MQALEPAYKEKIRALNILLNLKRQVSGRRLPTMEVLVLEDY
ncbi:hypothetical protein [Acidovorax sp. BLS4]|nr:hypothetical protein [Paracidovorax avenae]WOI45568.1 hypothetical protein R1Z03_24380 [Paracidovorax avenae]